MGNYDGHHGSRHQSALVFVLKGLIPYTQENLMLSFKPNLFFNELEKISRYKRRTLEDALRAAQRQKLIEQEADIVRLTNAGIKIIQPFIAEHLPKGAKLMVIFDIPEDMAVVRAKFRRILKDWHFQQAQKSVWVTSYDHKSSVKEVVSELGLSAYVQLYECSIL